MSRTTYERGESLVYPRIYPKLTFTPVFGRRGDFVWVDEVRVGWPDYEEEVAFVGPAVHDQRVDMLRSENKRLRELCTELWHELDAATQYDAGGVRGIVSELADSMREMGIEADG